MQGFVGLVVVYQEADVVVVKLVGVGGEGELRFLSLDGSSLRLKCRNGLPIPFIGRYRLIFFLIGVRQGALYLPSQRRPDCRVLIETDKSLCGRICVFLADGDEALEEEGIHFIESTPRRARNTAGFFCMLRG